MSGRMHQVMDRHGGNMYPKGSKTQQEHPGKKTKETLIKERCYRKLAINYNRMDSRQGHLIQSVNL